MIRTINKDAHIITTDWELISGEQILSAMENVDNLELQMLAEQAEKTHQEHEHEHHHHDGECCCGHDHEHEHEHEHHHDGECGCGHHHDHEHHDDGECGCGHHHDHDHEHHHHADEIFTSWGVETPNKYDKLQLDEILKKLAGLNEYGTILRAKGMLPCTDGTWMYFDLVPGEYEIREGKPDYTGRICVIGSNLEEDDLKELFQVAQKLYYERIKIWQRKNTRFLYS